MSDFVQRLVSLRGNRSKAAFSRAIGLAPQVYQRYEDGRVPSPDILAKIADRCCVSVDYLLGRAPASAPANASESPSPPSSPQLLREPRAEYLAAIPDYERRLRFLEDQCAAIVPQLDDIRRLLVSLLAEERRQHTPSLATPDPKEKVG